MDISDWIALGSAIVTLAGVVAAFLAVWVQLQSLTKQLQVQTFSEYTKSYQEIILKIPEIFDDQASLVSVSQSATFIPYMRAYFDLCFEEHSLHRQRLIDQRTWRIWEGGMRRAFVRSLIKEAWPLIKASSQYGQTFEMFVEDRM